MHHSELREERRELNYINLITQDSLIGMKVSNISIITYEDIRIIMQYAHTNTYTCTYTYTLILTLIVILIHDVHDSKK